MAHLVESEAAPGRVDCLRIDAGEPRCSLATPTTATRSTRCQKNPSSPELEAEDAESAARSPRCDRGGQEATASPSRSMIEPVGAEGMPGEAAPNCRLCRPSPRPRPPAGGNIVPLRNGHLTSIRPVLEPSKPNLSSAERNAFREIAKALGARIAGDDEPARACRPSRRCAEGDGRAANVAAAGDRRHTWQTSRRLLLPSRRPPRPAPRPTARLPNSHADVLDRLPIAVLVNRGDEALYANRTLLDLLDYADLDDLRPAAASAA
jgi:hypothetical protein